MGACIPGWVENYVRFVSIQSAVGLIRYMSVMQNLAGMKAKITKMKNALCQKVNPLRG